MSADLSELTAPQILAEQASRRGDHVFFDFAGDKWTYAAMDEAVTRAANGFCRTGIEQGQRVAYMLNNHADTAIVWLGLLRLGAIVVPVNTAYKGEFLRHQLADSEATVIVAEGEYVARIEAVAAGAPMLERLILRGAAVPAGSLTVLPLEEIKSGGSEPLTGAEITADTVAMLMYTSGTTGPSKGCIVTHGYITTCGSSLVRCYELREEDILWIPAPMYHFGCLGTAVMPTLLTGSTVALAPKFSLSEFWPEIERSQATIAFLISTMITLVAHAPDTDASVRCKGQLRMIQGAPLGEDIQAIFRDRFGVAHSGPAGFGITEACIMTMNRISEPSPGNASGKRFDVFDVKILNDEKQECPPGIPGLVYVKPNKPNAMMVGYWNNPEATERVFRDGWFNTGDIGMFDEDGYFYFVDRDKDYLRRGGENISSFEMERAFLQHAQVMDVAVHAVVSDLSEDEVKATIVLREGATITERELCEWSLDQVPAYAVPRYIEFRAELPKNMVGRVLKFQLRDEGRTPNTWDRQESDLAVQRRSRPVPAS